MSSSLTNSPAMAFEQASTSILKQLIGKEVCFPALKLILDDKIDVDLFGGELPKLTPTHYMNENKLSTEERHKLLCRQQKKMLCLTTESEVLVEPPIVVFQNYKFGETYNFPIVVRNISKNSQKVVILMDESNVFKFDDCSQRIAKFPCGMCIQATITFTPESAMEDYYHKLIVSSNTIRMTVPIIAVGTRPLLNAPDSLIFTNVPVRHWNIKPVTVLNNGKKTARFTLSPSGSFSVKPDKGVVTPNNAFTFEVGYFAEKVGTNEGEICVKYENGEEIYIYLRANAINCNIKISSPDLRCEDTFMGLQTKASIFIENNSDISAKFYWKELENIPNDMPDNRRLSLYTHKESDFEHQGEMLKVALESMLVENDSNTAIQIEENLIKSQDGPDPLYRNDEFQIYPLFGEIKPHSRTEVHLIFSPNLCAFYEGQVYLDVSGLEKRTPFKIYGRGLGPKFKMGFEILSVGDVTLGDAHAYEVPVLNSSEIQGTIQCDGLVGLPSGMEMKVVPLTLDVSPGQYSAFYVNFTFTGKPGPFEVEVKFSALDTEDAFYVTVKGTITYPSIRFTTTEAHMGNLSYGFPKTFFIPLVNDSMNCVQVELQMENDGIDPPVDYKTILKSFKNSHFTFDTDPAEFKIYPSKFSLRPRGMQKIQLTMYPNQVREIRNKLKCWITDSEGNVVEAVSSINIRGTVVVPALKTVTESVHLRDCYLQFPYQAEFVVKNPSDLPAMYCIVQKPSAHLKIESKNFVGVANPWDETKIPFKVLCYHAGESVAHFDLYAVGNEEKVLALSVKCEPIPPQVEASAKAVDFGKVEVLEEKLFTVDVINTSPLNFPFTTTIFQDDSSDNGESWKCEPETGMLPSQGRITINIKLMLQEVGYHYAGVRVLMSEPLKHTVEVKMKALGVGSLLVFDPIMEKSALLDFGTIFIKQERFFEYEITNHGVNPRVMEWRTLKDKAPLNRPEGKANVVAPPVVVNSKKSVSHADAVKKPRSAFVITPLKTVIPAGGSVKLIISAYSTSPKMAEEVWNIWSYVPAIKGQQSEERGGSPTRGGKNQNAKGKPPPVKDPQDLHLRPVILNEVKLHASFEAPGLKFSKRNMNFFIEATPSHENFVLQETLKIENLGRLPLRVRIRTKFPFSFYVHNDEIPTEESTYSIEPLNAIVFKVQFDGRHLRKELGMVAFDGRLEAIYEGLQATDSIELHGEVRFPQLLMERSSIDFGTITNGMEAVEQITVTNPGTFCLTYKWYIKPGSTTVQKNPQTMWSEDFHNDVYKPTTTSRLMLLKHKKASNQKDRQGSKTLASKPLFIQGGKDYFASIIGVNSADRVGASNYGDFTRFIKEKMYRSRMMDFIGLKDAEFEAEDEVNYLAYYNQNALMPKEEFNTNELVDIIPLAGVIQAGQSQTFTVVFYGYPDITFKTSLILYVEGGARKTVEVTGSTVPPTPKPPQEKDKSPSLTHSSP